MLETTPSLASRPNRRRNVAALLISTQLLAGAVAAQEIPGPATTPPQTKKPGKTAPSSGAVVTKSAPAAGKAKSIRSEAGSQKTPAGSGAKSAAGSPAAGNAAAGQAVPGAPGTAVGAPVAPPSPVPGAPPGTIRLDFHGTNIDTVLQAFSMAFKWTVVKDPACTGDVTVIETSPLNEKRAFRILQAVLEVRGFTAVLDDGVLKVMSVKRAIASTPTVRIFTDKPQTGDKSEFVRAVIPLSNAEASSLSKDLAPLLTEGASIIGAAGANALIITDTSSNIDALREIISALDKGAGNNEYEIFHLEHVAAKRMVDIINDLFKQIAPRTPPAPMGPPGQPQPFPQPGGPMAKADVKAAVAAVEDDRSNSIIVVGSADNLKRVKEIVTKLDEQLNPHTETKVYAVKFAEAQKLAEMVNDGLLGGDEKSGQKPQSNNFNPFGGGFNPFERRAQGTQTTSYSAGQTHIVADSRTNKLIITADADTMKVVEKLLEELDRQVEYATTTFNIKLKNSNAEDMAYVLAQAFGTSAPTSINPFFGGFFGGGNNTGHSARKDRRIPRRQGDDKNQRADNGAVGGGPAYGFRPDDRVGGLMADQGGRFPLAPGTDKLAQFFFDPNFNQRRRGSDSTTGRTTSGQYVNLLQLQGNVMVTPERNTNSLIITTSPENEKAVRDLVSELDVEVKQVLLEAVVAEVSLDRTTKFGIDYLFKDLRNKVEGVFPSLPSTGPFGVDPLAPGLRYTIIRGNFQAVITAIANDNKIHIVSTPSVFTSNNQEAEIEVTDSIPYLKGTTVGFGGQTTTDVDFKEVGLILNVTPRITAEGMVAVDVYQEDSNLVSFQNVGNNAQAPLTTQRVTDTSVTLRDGDTLVLGGLQKNARTNNHGKIPILGDIPIIGKLFRNYDREYQRTELVVFLTPRVINNADEARSFSHPKLEDLLKRLPDGKERMLKPEPNNGSSPDEGKKPERGSGRNNGRPQDG